MGPDYEAMYKMLFNRITDADRKLRQVINLLQSVQIECEEEVLRSDDPQKPLPNKGQE